MEKIQILKMDKGFIITINDKCLTNEKNNILLFDSVSDAVENLHIYINYCDYLQQVANTRKATTRGTTRATTGAILYTPYITPQEV